MQWAYAWDEDGERCTPRGEARYTMIRGELVAYDWHGEPPDLLGDERRRQLNANDASAARAIACQDRDAERGKDREYRKRSKV